MTATVKPGFLHDHPLPTAVTGSVDRLGERGLGRGLNAFHEGEDQG
jgi:hypothetical protein